MSEPPEPVRAGDADTPTAAERGLVRLLGVVRADPPSADPALAERVLRTVRWQRALRGALEVGGWVAGATVEVVGLLAGRGGRR